MMNPEKNKRGTIKKLLRFLLICILCFGIGLTVMFIDFSDQQEQQIIVPRIEGQQIDNTPFYVTHDDDLNTALASLNHDRVQVLNKTVDDTIDGILDVSSIDMDSFQALGAEIQENMRILKELAENYYRENADDDDLELVEEHFQVFKNLQILRELDRSLSYLMRVQGIPYTQYFARARELAGTDGKFVLEYEEPIHPAMKKYYRALIESVPYDSLIEAINGMLYFENVHYITFAEIEEINAYYSPDTQNITIGYELMDFIYRNLKKQLNSASENEEILIDSVFYVILHELGHAFIDIFDLQFVGMEEDVSDYLAVVLAIEILGYDASSLVEALFSAPVFYAMFLEDFDKLEVLDLSEEESPDFERIVYSDVHSLDSQRVIDILTLIHGARPLETEFLFEDAEKTKFSLSGDRLNHAMDIYLDSSNFWYNALAPYLRE